MIQHLLFVYGVNLASAPILSSTTSQTSRWSLSRRESSTTRRWTLGHLGAGSDALAGMLGLQSTFPDAWRDAFRRASIPSGDAADYPSKEQLLEQLRAQHDRVCEAIAAVDAE